MCRCDDLLQSTFLWIVEAASSSPTAAARGLKLVDIITLRDVFEAMNQ